MDGIEVLIHDSMQSMNKSTRDWTDRAARGECGWICADCLQTSPSGMPDECMLGQQRCTDLIKRDKLNAGVPPPKTFVITEAGVGFLKKALAVTVESLPEEDQREIAALEAYHNDIGAANRAVTKTRVAYINAALAEIKPTDGQSTGK